MDADGFFCTPIEIKRIVVFKTIYCTVIHTDGDLCILKAVNAEIRKFDRYRLSVGTIRAALCRNRFLSVVRSVHRK